MGTFSTALLEGLFYETEGRLTTDRGGFVDDLLAPLVGQDIQLAIHFVPQLPIDPQKWGGGSCLWQPAECPAGHHEHPDRILNIAVRGVLEREDTTWWVRQLDGKRLQIPLELLDGHHGRLAAASVFDVGKMRDAITGFDPDQIESLGVQATELRDMLSNLQAHLKRG